MAATHNRPATVPKILAKSWCVSKSKLLSFTHLWTIDNFGFHFGSLDEEWLKQESPFGCDKPDILMDEEQSVLWWVHLGRRSDRPTGVFIKFLPKTSPLNNEEQFKARFTVSILDQRNDKIYLKSDEKVRRIKTDIESCFELISCIELMDPSNGYLVDGKLRLFFEIQALVDLANISGPCHGIVRKTQHESIEDDYGRLLASSHLSDITLVVNGIEGFQREFKAHSQILGARSSVFAAMFTHSMLERASGRVNITDLDGDVLEKLLYYIYTGKIESLEKYAEDLLIASEKYGIDQLKYICEEWLCTQLNVDNVVTFLSLADMHNAEHLKINAKQFICKHSIQVLTSAEWMLLLKRNPLLIKDVFK